MRIASVVTLTTLSVALSIGTASRVKAADQSMTFTGLVQGVDVAHGIVIVRGPKPETQTPQSSLLIIMTKFFNIDQTTAISANGKTNSVLADVKNGDAISVSYVQTPNGQFLAKSVTDSGRQIARPPPSSYY